MSNKGFSKSLSNQWDGFGKRLSIEIMRDILSAVLIEENKKETAGDFSAGFWDQKFRLFNGEVVYLEPEVKDKKWWGIGWSPDRPFKYDMMDIPFRKDKNMADYFIVISSRGDYAWIVYRKNVDEYLKRTGGIPKRKITKFEPNGGDYFSTPVTMGVFLKKINGKWYKWQPDKKVA